MPHKKKQKKSNDAEKIIENSDQHNDAAVPAAQKDKISSPVHGSDDLRELIEKNIKWSQVIYNQNKKIRRRLTMMVLGSYIRLALILTPIVLALIYLPPLLDQYISQFGSLLGGSAGDVKSLYDIGSLLRGAGVDESQLQGIIESVQ